MIDGDGVGRMDDEVMERPQRSGSPWTVLFVISLGLLVAVVGFGAGMVAERAVFGGGSLFERAREIGGLGGDAGTDGDVSLPRLAEVERLIEDEYYFRPASPEALPAFREELRRDAVAGMAAAAAAAVATPGTGVDEFLRGLEYGAIRGMTDGLPDDYSTFLDPPEQRPLAEQLAGEYEGIGVVVDQTVGSEGALTIVSAMPGSPAEQAGLRSGDVLEQADGHPLAGLPSGEALALIRGPAGTPVRLTIRRPGAAESFVVEVVRAAIEMAAVVYHTAADGRVGWIQVSIFGDKTTQELDAALKRAKEEGVAGIVLDLRHNTGGWVTSAREMIGRFVPADRGPALYEDEEPAANGELEAESIVGGGEEVFDLPLVVLVDGDTASASEIVAGALRHYGRARLVGLPTYGKGSVQRVHDFADGSSVRITFAQWLTPDKQPIPEEGLRPDVVVEAPAGQAVGQDAQLERAVEEVLAGE